MKKIEKQIVNQYITNNNKIKFVGMIAGIPLPTHKFFINITDFSAIYNRFLLRELEKIVLNLEK
jgi:hypothetical protein